MPSKRKKSAASAAALNLNQCAVKAHAAVSKLWPTDSDTIAPLEGVECCTLANAHIEQWGPPNTNDRLNLLILAESHATTHANLVGQKPSSTFTILKSHHDHLGHLNLVHCLSYGESWMLPAKVFEGLSKTVQLGCKHGTPQFWRTLAALAGNLDFGENADPLDKAESRTAEEYTAIFADIEGHDPAKRESRVQAKLNIRQELSQRGILLADVSPVPIYAGGGTIKRTNQKTGKIYTDKANKLPTQIKMAIIKTAFEMYAQFLVQRYRPHFVLVFGTSVEQAISETVLTALCAAHGGHYLGALQHPSYNQLQGRMLLPHLRLLRDLAHMVQNKQERKSHLPQQRQLLLDRIVQFRSEKIVLVLPEKKTKEAVVQKVVKEEKKKRQTKRKRKKVASSTVEVLPLVKRRRQPMRSVKQVRALSH